MDLVLTDTLKQELVDYRNKLYSNKSQWLIDQIKHGILMGQLGLRVCSIPKKGYKKAKHIFNFWKKVESKYYFEDLNIVITDANIINTIDFVTNLGLSWFVTIEWCNSASFSQQMYTVYIKLR